VDKGTAYCGVGNRTAQLEVTTLRFVLQEPHVLRRLQDGLLREEQEQDQEPAGPVAILADPEYANAAFSLIRGVLVTTPSVRCSPNASFLVSMCMPARYPRGSVRQSGGRRTEKRR